MSLVEKISSNQRSWGLGLLREGQPVPPTLLGVRAGAVVISVVMPHSRVGDGVIDEALEAGYGSMLASTTDSFILSFETRAEEFTRGAKRALVTFSDQGDLYTSPIFSGGKIPSLGEREHFQVELELVDQLKRMRLKNKDYRQAGMMLGNKVLDLEERFA